MYFYIVFCFCTITMNKSILALVVLFFSFSAAQLFGSQCKSVFTEDGVTASLYYNQAFKKFVFTINNVMPGEYPNSAEERMTEVRLVSAGINVISSSIISFPNINGGAGAAQNFTTTISLTKCQSFLVLYQKKGVQKLLSGSFILDKTVVQPVAKRAVEEQGELAARGACDFTWGGSGYSAPLGTGTANPYYFRSGTSAATSVVISATYSDASVTGVLNNPNPNFGNVAANTNKQGNIVITGTNTGTFYITLTANYNCGSSAQVSSNTLPVYIS